MLSIVLGFHKDLGFGRVIIFPALAGLAGFSLSPATLTFLGDLLEDQNSALEESWKESAP